MATTYSWGTEWRVDVYPTHTDDNSVQESNVIYNIHWRLTGDDTTNTATVIGTQTLDVTDLSSFTDYDSVTPANVETWLEAALGSTKVQELKDNVQAQLTELATPTTESRTIQ